MEGIRDEKWRRWEECMAHEGGVGGAGRWGKWSRRVEWVAQEGAVNGAGQ